MRKTEEESEWYECPTCSYATNSYTKYIKHGESHRRTLPPDAEGVQTRSETTGLKFFQTVRQAFEHSINDPSVWKISFNVGDERVRLVSNGDGFWMYESLTRPLVNPEVEFNERSAE